MYEKNSFVYRICLYHGHTAGLRKGYADGAVYLSPLNEKIAAEGTQEAIDKAAEALKNGELFVFGGPLKGVSPDGEKIEVAEGDHFPEQEEASAPSWQYIIEGCNVVQ